MIDMHQKARDVFFCGSKRTISATGYGPNPDGDGLSDDEEFEMVSQKMHFYKWLLLENWIVLWIRHPSIHGWAWGPIMLVLYVEGLTTPGSFVIGIRMAYATTQ
jgi:hypothetical protein